METEILSSQETDLAQAAHWLHQHQPVAFPTETVYGLGAKVFDEIGIQRIYQLKGRPSDNPLIAHVADLSQVELLAESIPSSFYVLAEAFWPGPLTMVLPRRVEVPSSVSAGLPTIAIRMPSHPTALQLIKVVGEPLVAPSANLSGKPSPTTAQHVLEDLQGKVAAVIDDGPTTYGIESTVVNLTQPTPIILRPGSISPEQIESVLGQSVPLATLNEHTPVVSPGMKYRHYAPSTPVKVFTSWDEFLSGPNSLSPAPSLVLSNQLPPTRLTSNFTIKPLKAETLFSEFRAADQQAIQHVIVILDPTTQMHVGLMNRISKAAAATD